MMQRIRAVIAVGLAAVLIVAGVAPAVAQEPFPSRPLTLVVPFPPGGIADLTARPLATALEKILKVDAK